MCDNESLLKFEFRSPKTSGQMVFSFPCAYLAVMYRLFTFFLYRIDPEKVHYLTMWCLITFLKFPGARSFLRAIYKVKGEALPRKVAGMHFTNPVGLAAGFDKNGKYLNAMAVLRGCVSIRSAL